MSHSIMINGRTVPVTGQYAPEAVDSPLLKDWATSLDPRIVVNKVKVLALVLFGKLPKLRVGFMMIDAEMTLDGKSIPGVAFLRGDAVAIFVEVNCEGERYALMTVQPRGPVGELLVEIPAGMMDGSGHFLGKAADELREETDIEIDPAQLIDLCALAQGSPAPRGVYTSPGGSDEAIHYYWYRVVLSREELKALEGKATGLLEEGEQITLKVVPFGELARYRDGKLMTALGLLAVMELAETYRIVDRAVVNADLNKAAIEAAA